MLRKWNFKYFPVISIYSAIVKPRYNIVDIYMHFIVQESASGIIFNRNIQRQKRRTPNNILVVGRSKKKGPKHDSHTRQMISEWDEKTLENIEGSIQNRYSRQTCNIEYKSRRQAKQQHNTICVGHLYAKLSFNQICFIFGAVHFDNKHVNAETLINGWLVHLGLIVYYHVCRPNDSNNIRCALLFYF